MRNRFLVFVGLCSAIGLLFAIPLIRLIRLALHHGYSSHIVLIPAIVLYLLWSDRDKIFSTSKNAKQPGMIIAIIGAAALVGAIGIRATEFAGASDFLLVLSVLLLLIASFIAVFGLGAAREAVFPLALMVFVLPVPGALLQKLIQFLQAQSAELSYWMFTALHVPVLRDGFVMALPGATIQVAEECSGINSSVALLILMIIFAHETLRSNWRRALLVLLVIPFSVVKNAIRIVTLTMLAIKVDPSFLTGRLHHEGGFVFFLITLALVYPVWKLLQRSERNSDSKQHENTLSTSFAQTGR